MILAGDIGGTKTVLALYEESGGGVRQVRAGEFASRAHESFEAIVAQFFREHPAPALRACCFGVAGPVIDGKCHLTNLGWGLEEGALARALGAPRVKLLNDLAAAAYGMLFLRPEELSVLNPGVRRGREGNVAVIAAGTGLGEGMLYWDGARHHPVDSEGGHVDFAPRTEREIALLRSLRARFGDHVSYERLLSGPGLLAIYAFLRDSGVAPEVPATAARLERGDASAAVTELGLAGTDALCVEALDLFCSIYGAEAGNLALKCLALGGVFLGGGIAPRIIPALRRGGFLAAFTDKGRFSELLKGIEVSVALNPRAAVLGAAHFALRA